FLSGHVMALLVSGTCRYYCPVRNTPRVSDPRPTDDAQGASFRIRCCLARKNPLRIALRVACMHGSGVFARKTTPKSTITTIQAEDRVVSRVVVRVALTLFCDHRVVVPKPNHAFFPCQHPSSRAGRQAGARLATVGAASHPCRRGKFATSISQASRGTRESTCFKRYRKVARGLSTHAAKHATCIDTMPATASTVCRPCVRARREDAVGRAAVTVLRGSARVPGDHFKRPQTGTPGMARRSTRRGRASRAMHASVVALDQGGVIVRCKQLVHLVRFARLDHEQPAFAEGVFIDRLRRVGQRRVDLDDRAGHRC